MSNVRTGDGRPSGSASTAGAGVGRGPGMFGPGRGRGGPFGGHGFALPAEKPKNFKASLKRLLGYLRPRLMSLVAVFGMAILSTSFAIFSPKILGSITTRLFEGIMAKMRRLPGAGIDFPYILQLVLIVAGLYLLSAIFAYVQQFIMAGVAQKTVYEMRREVSEKLARLPLKFYDGRTHGEILSRVTNDVDNIASTLQQSLMQIITSGFTLIGVLIMMLTISPMLTLITIVVIPLALIVTRVIAPRAQKHFTEQWKNLGELNGHVEEMYSGHSIVKAFGHERKSIEKFNTMNEKLYGASWRAQFISGLMMPLMMFVNNIGYVAVAVVGGIMVTHRAIAIGDIQAFIQYARQFTMPIAQTANIANILQSTIASAERVFELLDEPEEVPDASDAMILSAPRGDVGFESVHFSYKPEAPLIEDLNIAVKQGQTIAIVGPTGAGKTTLVNLLMRFYEIQGGRIMVDGVDIREISRGSLRCTFGMVLQDTWLFNGTIRDNIAYGKSQVTEEEIHSAAVAAHADHFIRTLPDGYDTVLNEEASNISQGQKQLLTIARAILTDPAVLILDEATSSVDTRTEVLIQKAMATLMKGRTSFVIAHRLSTIRDAEMILVMNHGRIIETGNHRDLLAKGGFYADLYNSQFTGALTENGIAAGLPAEIQSDRS
jgi:ATP-binding cassette subfamily B multidrug efflux pump